MKKIIPFTKTIKFKTMIAEITDIETKHNLEVEGNTIEGDILLDGKYKMHEASQIEEEFHYNLPFTIEVDNKYDISNCTITIDDFYFEIINEEDLKINIELEISNVLEKPLPKEDISLDEEVIRKTVEKIPIVLVIKFVFKKNLKSIFITPAKIHKISSGKNGKSIIRKKTYFPFLSLFCKTSVFSFPIAQLSTFIPRTFPIKYAEMLPRRMARRLKKKAITGPKRMTPTIVVTIPGIGKMVTCKN